MNLRLLLGASSALLLVGSAQAQSDVSSKLLPLPGAPQDGGVFDVASGTWTTDLSAGAASAKVLYDNTCSPSAFLSLDAGERVVDTGRLPSTTSPLNLFSVTGDADAYDLSVLRVVYCTSEPSPTLRLNLFESFDACSDAGLAVPDLTVDLPGAPGSSDGSVACWSIAVDLGNLATVPNLAADGDGVFDNSAPLDTFGFSFEQLTAPVTGPAGPVVAGDPFGLLGGAACGWGAGTAFGTGSEGTGVGTDDLFELDAAGSLVSCSFFGGYFFGNRYASLFLEVGGGEPVPAAPGTKFCFGDGAGTACPCNNSNDGSLAGGQAGCANGTSAGGAALDVSGTNGVAAADLVFEAQGLVPMQPGLFFQGENAINGGLGNPFGDGLRCAGGNVQRLGVRTASALGVATSTGINVPVKGGVSAGQTRRYQFWYRDPAGSPCGSAFNLTNGVEVTWQP